MFKWQKCDVTLPEDGQVVEVKISDDIGERNHCELKRNGNLWFFPDGSMYVYWTPTHWRHMPN